MTKGKTNFTKEEIEKLKDLIARRETADSTEQKSLRGKIRKIGLYWSEIGQGMPYTVANFENLINRGVITVENKQTEGIISSVTKTSSGQPITTSSKEKKASKGRRNNSDEHYVIDLCDEVLGAKGSRQAKFDFLRGDKGHRLPVDAYYENKNLVVEYYERQHTEAVKLFDNKMTASGVTRDVQRRIYDERRKTEFPKHGIDLVVISYTDFGSSKKLKRDRERDLAVVRKILKPYLP